MFGNPTCGLDLLSSLYPLKTTAVKVFVAGAPPGSLLKIKLG
jgi:hypothetical protein